MRVRHLAALTLAVAVCALVGGTPAISGAPVGPPPPNCDPNAVQVNIVNFGYDPDTLTVPVGTTVCWVNQDMTPHTVTSDVEGVFDSGSLQQGQTFEYTFNSAGSFPYHCLPHAWMIATVTVTGAAAATSTSTTATAPTSATAAPPPGCPTGATLANIVDYAFDPPTLNVTPGTTVCWTNNGVDTHSVTSDTGAFDSGLLAPQRDICVHVHDARARTATTARRIPS